MNVIKQDGSQIGCISESRFFKVIFTPLGLSLCTLPTAPLICVSVRLKAEELQRKQAEERERQEQAAQQAEKERQRQEEERRKKEDDDKRQKERRLKELQDQLDREVVHTIP